MEFIAQQLFFYFAIALVLFLPGWFLLNLIEARKKYFSILEKFVISAGLSIVSVNFLLIIISKLGILINKTSVIFSIFSFILILQLIIHIIKKSCDTYPRSVKSVTEEINALKFSKNQTILIVLILFLTVFIKTAYLSNTIFPTSTDLGHHMYWSKLIAETGELPAYAKQEIISADGNYSVSRPEPIADFIIGEHLIFSAVALISGADFISSFPSLILLLVNIFSLLAFFVLALRFFAGSPGGKNIPILALFLLGPLYAISSPQAKFVSGGVIGNLLGNLLIPLVLYFFYRALTEKNSNFALLGVLCSAGVFYAHHLSALILLFALLFSLVIFSLLNFRNLLVHMKSWAGILFSKQVVGIILFLAFFALFVHLPEYFEKSAVDTAIGAPSKSTRLGLTFAQLKFSAGEPRLALALAGIIVVLASRARTFYRSAFLLGWAGSLFVMSLKPGWLFIDIPSRHRSPHRHFGRAHRPEYSHTKALGQSPARRLKRRKRPHDPFPRSV